MSVSSWATFILGGGVSQATDSCVGGPGEDETKRLGIRLQSDFTDQKGWKHEVLWGLQAAQPVDQKRLVPHASS
jgi:hypothetical protein